MSTNTGLEFHYKGPKFCAHHVKGASFRTLPLWKSMDIKIQD